MLTVLAIFCEKAEEPTEGEFLPELEDTVFTELNQTRVEQGYETLDLYTDLHEFSREHAKDMGDNDYYSHTTPDGKTLADRFDESGIVATAVGECIWMKNGDVTEIDYQQMANAILADWMADDADLTTVLDADYNQGSVGCYRIADRLYVTFNGIEK